MIGITLGKTYSTTLYSIDSDVYSFTPDRESDYTFKYEDGSCWCNGVLLFKNKHTVYLWLNYKLNLCVELVEVERYVS